MSNKTINAQMLEKFENEVLNHTTNAQWANVLEELNDTLTGYLLNDTEFVGNSHTSDSMFHLRVLRDFFKDLDDLAH